MKKLILIILILNFNSLITYSQTIFNKLEYSYDANGNRISRTVQIVLNKNTGENTEISTNLNKNIGEIYCYPNPTSGIFNIKFEQTFSSEINCFYTIINMEGKLIMKGEIKGKSSTIDISNLNDGMYLLNLNSSLGTRKIKISKLTN